MKTVWPQPERVIALGDVHGDAQVKYYIKRGRCNMREVRAK